MKLLSRIPALAGASLAATTLSLALELHADVREIDVGSVYLAHELEVAGHRAHRIRLCGELDGSAALFLDANPCSLDRFGDPVLCTEMAVLPRPVTLTQLAVPDPLGLGRRLYEIRGLRSVERHYLVVPGNSARPALLVQEDASGAVSRVIPLL